VINEPTLSSTAREKFVARLSLTILVLVLILVGLFFLIGIQDKTRRSDALSTPVPANEGARLDPAALGAENYGLTNLVAPLSGLSDTNRVSN
jgi:hypothetical protein